MADNVDKITNRVRRQLKATDSEVEAFVARLEKFLNLNLEEIIGSINAGEVSGGSAAKILGSMFTELNKAGLGAEIGRLRAIFAKELGFVRDEFIEQNFEKPLADIDRAGIDALIDTSIAQVGTKVQQYGLNIQTIVMQNVLTGQKPNFKELREKFGDTAASQIQTEVNTSLMAFNRTVTVNKAIDLGFDLFVYIGPDDKITRDFCKHLLDRSPPIYKLSEIKGMKNGQDLDVFTYGGGYNCRHQWRPITLEDAIAKGYKA